MLDWFRALLPKEERFFDLFEQHATLVVAGAESLRAALEGGPDLPQHLQAVVERENEADAITREVLLAVRRSFITPFDRGDIKDLITQGNRIWRWWLRRGLLGEAWLDSKRGFSVEALPWKNSSPALPRSLTLGRIMPAIICMNCC